MRDKWVIKKRPVYEGARRTGEWIWRVWSPGMLYSSQGFDTWAQACAYVKSIRSDDLRNPSASPAKRVRAPRVPAGSDRFA